MITLEPILSKILEAVERLRAPPKAGLRLKQNFLSFKNSGVVVRAKIKNCKENFVFGVLLSRAGGGGFVLVEKC